MLKEIESHKIAADKLIEIKNKVFDFIGKNLGKITEYDAQQFILAEFKKNNLIWDRDDPIVAAGENTSLVHYFPKKESKLIDKNMLILIDIWARLKEENSLFADITWMAYSGQKVPQEIQEAFNQVALARNGGIKFIEESLKNKEFPDCGQIDCKVRESFGELGKNFLHTTGHSLGNLDCHGEEFIISSKCDKKIQADTPFTIEPGIYFENKFGIRSEIDCYIDKKFGLIITTDVQDKIILL